jgi:hypothetical protein
MSGRNVGLYGNYQCIIIFFSRHVIFINPILQIPDLCKDSNIFVAKLSTFCILIATTRYIIMLFLRHLIFVYPILPVSDFCKRSNAFVNELFTLHVNRNGWIYRNVLFGTHYFKPGTSGFYKRSDLFITTLFTLCILMATRTVESYSSPCNCIASLFLHWFPARYIATHSNSERENMKEILVRVETILLTTAVIS